MIQKQSTQDQRHYRGSGEASGKDCYFASSCTRRARGRMRVPADVMMGKKEEAGPSPSRSSLHCLHNQHQQFFADHSLDRQFAIQGDVYGSKYLSLYLKAPHEKRQGKRPRRNAFSHTAISNINRQTTTRTVEIIEETMNMAMDISSTLSKMTLENAVPATTEAVSVLDSTRSEYMNIR